jgi:hypothetical protein
MMKKRGGKKMSVLAEFIQQNKQKIRRVSDSNSSKKSDGIPVIKKDDPWRDETEWDDHYRELDKDK